MVRVIKRKPLHLILWVNNYSWVARDDASFRDGMDLLSGRLSVSDHFPAERENAGVALGGFCLRNIAIVHIHL